MINEGKFEKIEVNHDYEEVSDVLQETYMRFIHTVDRYQKNTNVLNYLITIARNIAIFIYNTKIRYMF